MAHDLRSLAEVIRDPKAPDLNDVGHLAGKRVACSTLVSPLLPWVLPMELPLNAQPFEKAEHARTKSAHWCPRGGEKYEMD